MIDLKFLKRFSNDEFCVCPEIFEIDEKLTNVPYIVLPISRIEPDDWDLFWNLWNKGKTQMGDSAMWESLGIWTNPSLKKESVMHKDFPFLMENWGKYFPKMFEQIMSAMPFKRIDNIRLSMNIKRVTPHLDPTPTMYPWPNSLRVMLYDSNEHPTFYLMKWPEHSYNQPPIPKIDVIENQTYIPGHIPQEEKIYVNLPKNSNTFLFSNGEFLHGADFSNPKIIMIITGIPDPIPWKNRLYELL